MQKATKLILGNGDVTDHKHVLVSKSSFDFTRELNCIRFILRDMGVQTHDEHDRIVYSPGSYRSYHQVEFNPMDNSVNRVFD